MSQNNPFQQTSAREMYLRAVPSTSKSFTAWLAEHHPSLSEPIQRRLVLVDGLYGQGEILVGYDFLRSFVPRRQIKGKRLGSVETVIEPIAQALSGVAAQHDRKSHKARRILVDPDQSQVLRAEVEAFRLSPFALEAICPVTGEALAGRKYGSTLRQAGKQLRGWINETYRDHRLHQVLEHLNGGRVEPQVLLRFQEMRQAVEQEMGQALAQARSEEERAQAVLRYQRRLAQIDATWCSLQVGPIYLPNPRGDLLRNLIPTPDSLLPEDRRRLFPPEDGYRELALEGGRLPVLAKLIQEPELEALLDRGAVLEELARASGDLAAEAIKPWLEALVDGAGNVLQAALLSTKTELRRPAVGYLRQLRTGYQVGRYSNEDLLQGLEEAEELLDAEARTRLRKLQAHPAIAGLIAGRRKLKQAAQEAGGLPDARGTLILLQNQRRVDSLIWTVSISYQRCLLETVYAQAKDTAFRVVLDLGEALVVRIQRPDRREATLDKLTQAVSGRAKELGLRTSLIEV